MTGEAMAAPEPTYTGFTTYPVFAWKIGISTSIRPESRVLVVLDKIISGLAGLTGGGIIVVDVVATALDVFVTWVVVVVGVVVLLVVVIWAAVGVAVVVDVVVLLHPKSELNNPSKTAVMSSVLNTLVPSFFISIFAFFHSLDLYIIKKHLKRRCLKTNK